MKEKIHIGDDIREELYRQERSIAWLAAKIDYDSSNLRKLLINGKINRKILLKISEVLGKDFFEIYLKQYADYLYYTTFTSK